MFRFLRRARVLSLVALLIVTGSVPASMTALLHDDRDDVLCQPSIILHDDAAHRIGAAHTAVPEPQHCAVCHWLHSIQIVVENAAAAGPAADFETLAAAALPPGSAPVGHQLPARAPPQA